MLEENLFGDFFTPQEETAVPAQPKTDAAPKQIDIASLSTALRKNGSVKLSDHTIKDIDEKTAAEQTQAAEPVSQKEKTAPAAQNATPAKAKDNAPKKGKTKLSAEEKMAAAKKAEDNKIGAEGFGAWLKAYLDDKAAENEEFAKVYAKPEKNLKDCILYITAEAFKKALKGMAIISNDIIEGLAMHYYQEDNIQIPKDDNISFVVASQVFPMTQNDIDVAAARANEAMVNERIELEKKRMTEEILSGKREIKLTDDEQKEIDAAAREALIEKSKQRQSKNTARVAAPKTITNKKPATDQPTLF